MSFLSALGLKVAEISSSFEYGETTFPSSQDTPAGKFVAPSNTVDSDIVHPEQIYLTITDPNLKSNTIWGFKAQGLYREFPKYKATIVKDKFIDKAAIVYDSVLHVLKEDVLDLSPARSPCYRDVGINTDNAHDVVTSTDEPEVHGSPELDPDVHRCVLCCDGTICNHDIVGCDQDHLITSDLLVNLEDYVTCPEKVAIFRWIAGTCHFRRGSKWIKIASTTSKRINDGFYTLSEDNF